MTRKPTNKRRSGEETAEDVEGNVDKIRQILFGGQMRDYEKRFDAMEKRLTQSIERVSRDIERRLERVDTFARREVEKLAEQLKSEKRDRVADSKKGSGELQSLIDQVETWFAEVDEQMAKDAKNIRLEIIDQSELLAAQIRDNHEQLTASLQQEADELADKKLARDDMASLLSEFAMRLSKDFKLPKA